MEGAHGDMIPKNQSIHQHDQHALIPNEVFHANQHECEAQSPSQEEGVVQSGFWVVGFELQKQKTVASMEVWVGHQHLLVDNRVHKGVHCNQQYPTQRHAGNSVGYVVLYLCLFSKCEVDERGNAQHQHHFYHKASQRFVPDGRVNFLEKSDNSVVPVSSCVGHYCSGHRNPYHHPNYK